MINVTFYTHPQVGKQVKTDHKYILLYYYLSDRRSIDTLITDIQELEIVKSGEKTFEEVFDDVYGTISISVSAGEFECDKDTAYFISNHTDKEPSFEMPLQDLIDIEKQWLVYLQSK